MIGSQGIVKIKEGIIIPRRHLHCNSAQAKKFNLKNKKLVSIKIAGERSATLHNIIVRVGANFDLAVHLDTDEANASMLRNTGGVGELLN